MAEPAVKPHKTEKVGQVVSVKMDKTIVVQVTRRVQHPFYKKVVTRKKKFYAHDEENNARVGDIVRVIESRPMSKLKRWRLGEVLRRAMVISPEAKRPRVTRRKSAKPRKAGGG